MALTILSQQDSRWASKKLGNTPYTIGRWGCLNVVVNMIFNYAYGRQKTPDNVAQILSFTPEGLLLWKSLEKLNLRLEKRFYGHQSELIGAAYKDPARFIALQVNNNHWVWLIGRKLPVLGYRIADPFTGTICYTNRYKNNITGGAIISKF